MTTDQTDFIGLYRELGVEPDCSVDQFRLAYRRRVADLHPDRVGASGEDDLKVLNLSYAAALEFHRHYGRLPGAAPVVAAARRSERAPVPEEWAEEVHADAMPVRRTSRFLVYGMLVIAALLIWWWSRTDAEPVGNGSAGIADNQRKTDGVTDIRLAPGMTPEQVLALHGEPLGWEEESKQWLYGPSWIRFRCARVVDWYSSPLKPLKVAASKPNSAELARLHAEQGPLCPPMPKPRTRQWPTSP